ncbi:hypothetical protein ABZ499_16140 [Streptomyces sp. NPDC019990]|uniref:hypothetical protein n=1 Tax=Streptomyces sp. NPDC019990 TaxID=3154693 RepID=UPI0033D802B4
MTPRGAWAPRTRAAHGAVRWVPAAVIALLAALAVLMHHETAPAAIGSAAPSARHAMTPGTMMPGGHAAPVTTMSGHRHTSAAGQAAEPTTAAPSTMSGADGPLCSGMAMQHCSTAGSAAVKVPVPIRTWVPWQLPAPGAVAPGPHSAGTAQRAPPDLSVLSQLRI